MFIKSKFKLHLILVLVFCLGLIALTIIPTFAITYGTGDYGECLYSAASTNCDISITNNAFTLLISDNPTVPGACTVQNDQVTVNTYDPAGYTLTLGNETTTTGLVNGSSTIPASTGTPASPIALSDTWGYRVDGYSGFSGTTSAETNATLSTISSFNNFAGPKASNLTADTIASTSTLNPSVATTIWYGVCLDTSLGIPFGPYTTTVLYTATAN